MLYPYDKEKFNAADASTHPEIARIKRRRVQPALKCAYARICNINVCMHARHGNTRISLHASHACLISITSP